MVLYSLLEFLEQGVRGDAEDLPSRRRHLQVQDGAGGRALPAQG